MAEVERFVAGLHPDDWTKSLAQLLLKLTVPGVPDLYQGAELWQLTLSDPDNRAPVDFALRERLLGECATLTAEQVLARAAEGLPKMWTTVHGLALRQRSADLHPLAAYKPLAPKGQRAGDALAFARGRSVVVVVPVRQSSQPWGETALELPPGHWRHLLGDGEFTGEVRLDHLFRPFPVALLERSER
jgi:(1->4)-alpha-D-glucan 1-alpha-D-glucosylmutase